MRIHILHRLTDLVEDADVVLRRRASFALGRFAARIDALRLRISDVNGPRGGVGFSCLARVRLRSPAIEVVASAEDSDPMRGAALAIDRARSGVARAIERSLRERA